MAIVFTYMMDALPFVSRNVHSDNGSQYINHKVADGVSIRFSGDERSFPTRRYPANCPYGSCFAGRNIFADFFLLGCSKKSFGKNSDSPDFA
ncbi:hypothetical protein QZJ86_10665 [Methylomonas montana]|uniref:hypothetical protein n=1 Tax=Methylomonas montana TaxID=3058963 RepID=UPI00265B15E9|nr:hypothetical protein [Methylomonas montana]WKJ92711.1 hypothetical protein QZJ86_10665 [Methylomonas montana]